MKRLLFTSSGLAALVVGAGLALAQQGGQMMQQGAGDQTGVGQPGAAGSEQVMPRGRTRQGAAAGENGMGATGAPCVNGQANCEPGAGVVRGRRTTGEAAQAPGAAAPSANAQGYGRQNMPAETGRAAQTQCAPGQANCQAQPGTSGELRTGQTVPRTTNRSTARAYEERNRFRATCPGNATNCVQPGQPGMQGQTPQGMQQGVTGTLNRPSGEAQEARAEGEFNLQPRRAAQLHERLARLGVAETTNVNFNVRVGVALPPTVAVRPLPPEIIAEYPEFRGYDFIIVRGEIVIVEPRTRRVVEVIAYRGPQYGSVTTTPSRLHLTREERERIRHVIIARPSSIEFQERVGAMVPPTVALEPLPEVVVTTVPQVRPYEYFVTRDDRIVIVDPSSREAIDVID